MRQSQTIAACGMTAALSVVLMILGNVLGLGMYASPMLAGLCLMPIGRKYGPRCQWALWACVSLLCFFLVSNAEETLMYICLFGLYPLLYPHFEKLPRRVKLLCKLLFFNLVVIAVEALVMLVLMPEVLGTAMLVVLLVMGNAVFLCYDFLLPRTDVLMKKYLGRWMK